MAQTLREKVLMAAVKYVADYGPDGLSFRQIAADSGVSHQAPYHYFGDRSGIFAAISEEGFSALAGAFRDVDFSNTSAAKAGFIAYLNFARSHVGHFRVMFRQDICGVTDNEETANAASSAFDELLQMVARTIGSSVDPKAAHSFAFTMWSQAHGLATLVIDGPLPQKLPPGVSLEDQIDEVINLCSHMVALEAAEMGLVPSHS